MKWQLDNASYFCASWFVLSWEKFECNDGLDAMIVYLYFVSLGWRKNISFLTLKIQSFNKIYNPYQVRLEFLFHLLKKKGHIV